MKNRKYLKGFLILLMISIFLTGCSSQDDEMISDIKKEQENEDNREDEIEDIVQSGKDDDSKDDSQSKRSEKKSTEELETEVQRIIEDNTWGIILGEYGEYSGLYDGSDTWSIQREGFIPRTNSEGVSATYEWMDTAAGIIEFVQEKIEYYCGETDCPMINNRCCERQYNLEKTESGWFCEVEMLAYYGVMKNEALRYFWCIIDIDDESNSKWIYLNQEVFTKEEALVIAEYLREK